MKARNILNRSKVFLLFLAVVSGMVLITVSCDFASDDGGGEGADFDATLYYTKADIDGMLPLHGQNPIVGLDDTVNSYANGTAITVPAGYRYVLVQLSGGDATTTSDIHIGVGDGENYANTLPAYGTGTGNETATQLMFFNLEDYQSGGVRVWATDLDEGISAFTALWFR